MSGCAACVTLRRRSAECAWRTERLVRPFTRGATSRPRSYYRDVAGHSIATGRSTGCTRGRGRICLCRIAPAGARPAVPAALESRGSRERDRRRRDCRRWRCTRGRRNALPQSRQNGQQRPGSPHHRCVMLVDQHHDSGACGRNAWGGVGWCGACLGCGVRDAERSRAWRLAGGRCAWQKTTGQARWARARPTPYGASPPYDRM